VRTISLKLPDDLLSQLEDLAKTRRMTKSQIVRASLERAFRRDSAAGSASCYDLARDLAGAIKGLPTDLAHNPKYMDGFGK
jgi:predicted transcriptional regulator